jgi:hypothetical protein
LTRCELYGFKFTRKLILFVDNLLVLLIGGIPIAMPTVLSVTMAIGSHKLAQQVWAEFTGRNLAGQLCYGRLFFSGYFAGCYHQKNDCKRKNG